MLRTITVVSSDTQSRTTFEADVETVSSLLSEFDARGIDYTDKSIFEGISKSEFSVENGEGILPHDTPWRGESTNNLVVMLTPARKKIASGLTDRHEILMAIKDAGLQQAVKEAFGKQYTNVTTAELEDFLAAQQQESTGDNSDDCSNDCPYAEAAAILVTMIHTALADKVIPAKLVIEMLQDLGYIEEVKNVLPKTEKECPYSDEELRSMFNFAD